MLYANLTATPRMQTMKTANKQSAPAFGVSTEELIKIMGEHDLSIVTKPLTEGEYKGKFLSSLADNLALGEEVLQSKIPYSPEKDAMPGSGDKFATVKAIISMPEQAFDAIAEIVKSKHRLVSYPKGSRIKEIDVK